MVPAAADSPVIAPLAPVVVGVDGLTEIAVIVTDADGDEPRLTATSSNTAIATVEVDAQTLTVTGEALGQTTITVTADDGSTAHAPTTTFRVRVVADGAWSGVSVGEEHSCGRHANGTVECWGDNAYNQVNTPPTSADFVAVSAGGIMAAG